MSPKTRFARKEGGSCFFDGADGPGELARRRWDRFQEAAEIFEQELPAIARAACEERRGPTPAALCWTSWGVGWALDGRIRPADAFKLSSEIQPPLWSLLTSSFVGLTDGCSASDLGIMGTRPWVAAFADN